MLLEGVCTLFTLAGGEAVGILVGALLLAFDRSGARAWRTLSGLLLASGLVVLLKGLVKAPRPPPEWWLVEAQGYSFPSGHAAVASALAVAVALGYGRWPGAALTAYAACVSLSRIVLGVHWPIDVVGGAIVGAASAAIAWRLLDPPRPDRLAAIALSSTLMGLAGALLDPGYESPQLLAALSLGALLGIVACHAAGGDLLAAPGRSKGLAGLAAFLAVTGAALASDVIAGLVPAGAIIVAARCRRGNYR